MSEVKLNLIDSQTILSGTIHGSIGDACIAALSAEPETIAELEAALARYQKCLTSFCLSPTVGGVLAPTPKPDLRPHDAGILVIDLAARIVAIESTYSQPDREGQVAYHDGTRTTDIPVLYRVPDDWIFLSSISEYEGLCDVRRQERATTSPLDARAILYGRPLLEFIAREILSVPLTLAPGCGPQPFSFEVTSTEDSEENFEPSSEDWLNHPLADSITAIHARWLTTQRDDLRGQSPRDVMLARQDFIDFDLHTRSLQWSLQFEGPPCLASDSVAYRFAGFGTHEWVIYYELVRHLLWSALRLREGGLTCAVGNELTVNRLEQLKTAWLQEPNHDLDGRIPEIIIDNERKRLPEAMAGRSMVVDEDCPICRMMGDQCEAGLEICFWHLDGCNMDDEFAFSPFRTRMEWEEEQRCREVFSREFDLKWKEREQRIARGESLEPDSFFNSLDWDEFVPWTHLADPEIPEA